MYFFVRMYDSQTRMLSLVVRLIGDAVRCSGWMLHVDEYEWCLSVHVSPFCIHIAM